LDAIAQAMRCRVSSIALDALEVKLSMHGAKKAGFAASLEDLH